jgi:hypothetical protein
MMTGFSCVSNMALLALWALAGCGGAPAGANNVEPSAMLDQPGETTGRFDWRDGVVMKRPLALRSERAWQLMPEVYDAVRLGGGVVDSEKRIFGAQHTTYTGRPGNKPLSKYLDCGSQLTGPNADHYAVGLTVLTQVRAADSTTILDTRIEAFAKPRSVSGNRLSCSTTGLLEKLIADELETRAKPR